jgi:hypothetical protein
MGKGATPLSWCVLGTKNLHAGKEYIICYITPEQVAAVSQAIDQMDVPDLAARYRKISPDSYSQYGDEDFQYTWDYFTNMRNLYAKAAETNRGMFFLVDQ